MGMNLDKTTKVMNRLLFRVLSGKEETCSAVIPGILSQDAFELELVKERARADRTNTPFTLVAFDIQDPQSRRQEISAAKVLASVLQERTRLIDTAGWFRGQLGLILPHTPCEHAAHVCGTLQEAFAERMQSLSKEGSAAPEIRCESFAYPMSLAEAEENVAEAAPLPSVSQDAYAYSVGGR